MKRFRIISVFLFLGIIINISIAWACAYWTTIEPPGMLMAWKVIPELDTGEGWSMHRKLAFGATQILALSGTKSFETDDPDTVYPYWSSLPHQMQLAADRAQKERNAKDPASRGQFSVLTVLMQKGYGWPLRSMHWDWNQRFAKLATPAPDPLRWGYQPTSWNAPSRGSSLDEKRALPLGVIPFGFLINTLLFATITASPFITIATWRRWRRWRRNRRNCCPDCGYDLRGAPPESMQCPECGSQYIAGETT